MPAQPTIHTNIADPLPREPIQTTGSIITLLLDADGCAIVLSESAHPFPLQTFQLPTSAANYNAMYALLLASGINRLDVDVYHRPSLVPEPAGTDTPAPQIVTSVRGRYVSG